MGDIDLNLLDALDVLLKEGSVTAAARRLRLSPSAMSRTLMRLRNATGDPLLVRAGRHLVPTPRAAELRERVHALAREVHAVLSPQSRDLDLASLDRTFTIRANEGFVERFAASMVVAIISAAPRVRLRFAPKPDKTPDPLRAGDVDMEIGVLGEAGPELRAQAIFRDEFVGAVRSGHTLLAGDLTPRRYAAASHVVASRRGASRGPVDDVLQALGLRRETVVTVPSFSDALRIARRTDLVALVPRSCLAEVKAPSDGLVAFELPVRTPEIVVSAMWHPRMEADAGHRWFRETIMAQCRKAGTP